MLRLGLFLGMAMGLIGCNIYKIAEKHIDKHMQAGNMQCFVEVVQGDTLEYWDNRAEKPVIILVHGFGASSKYQWFKQVEWLSQHYRVIMPNLNYFGGTRPAEPRYGVNDQVNLVLSLVDHLQLKKFDLCGVSYGGLVSCEIALKRPESIGRMVVFDAPVKFMYAEDIQTTCERFKVESVQELFAPSSPKGLKKLMYLASMKRSIIPASWMTEFYNELYAKDLDDKRKLITQLLADVDALNQKNYPLNMPILLIWGDNDPVIPVDRGALLQQHIGENAQFAVIRKGAHMPNLTKTKQFNAVFEAFLSEGF